MVEPEVRQYLAALRDMKTFERGASALLDLVNRESERQLGKSPENSARVLRSLAHMRPQSHYHRLAVRELLRSRDGRVSPIAPSATAWRWVSEHSRPAAIDVRTGTIGFESGGELVALSPAALSPWETQMQLLARDATHVLAVPIFGASKHVDGMITVEVACPAAVGRPLFDVELIQNIEALADVSAPYLRSLPSSNESPFTFDPLLPVVGETMAPIVSTLQAFAALDETLLLFGDTGVGKSRLARYCHQRSPRAKAPFEAVHLASKPSNLRMAELFGWRRGAFTGATSDHAGYLARAEGGTLFVDEIDKLSLEDQAGLLQVLEDGTYRPLGEAGADRKGDVRFILGTNADLKALVEKGEFRRDLFYRIHVLPVRIPPLAERRDEILAWATVMLRSRPGQQDAEIAPDAGELLEAQPWPGNLRQLENVVRRAHALLGVEGDRTDARPAKLQRRDLQRALAFESDGARGSLFDALHAAATAFVVEAEARKLDLDLTDCFRGMVLRAAAEKTGSVERAFRLLGRESVVEHRNHTKILRKELAKVEALCAALGVDFAQLVPTPRDEDS